ncbi:MAG: carbamoyl phosphate synthase small subunit [Bdellovibrionaceae bacterium]|nr:carbamoyl phosphate synthase small subunit [Pseudobdellovibrionaceae bacterium]|tara:strand:- start:18221 stop:19282 length:1062 start_codon:yes stop_codon:yes gene_type:complete
MAGYLVLESGEVFQGNWRGGEPKAGEVVFNTSHSGYEEIATDPSYHNQIMVMTTSQLGNYGVDESFWESKKLHITGFVALEIQSDAFSGWKGRLDQFQIPSMDQVDTRSLVLTLREKGTVWGALVEESDEESARKAAKTLIVEKKQEDLDWAYATTCSDAYVIKGEVDSGPRVAVMDFGCKTNILRELQKRCKEVKVFPSRATADQIKEYDPQGILLSNGPGNPEDVKQAQETIRNLLGWRTIFGICMGHQLLCLSMGGKTFRLKFGHRGSNHPIKDDLLKTIYITSQNHGYAVESGSLPEHVEETHFNLNDNTLAGINSDKNKCFSVQFHPESHPGPRESELLFDHFIKRVL